LLDTVLTVKARVAGWSDCQHHTVKIASGEGARRQMAVEDITGLGLVNRETGARHKEITHAIGPDHECR